MLRRLLLAIAIVFPMVTACSAPGSKVTSTAGPSEATAASAGPTTLPSLTPGPTPVGLDLSSLSPEARKAAEVAVAPGHGYTAVVTAVTLESYRDLMCGRQPYAAEDVAVWAVALFITSRPPYPIPKGYTPPDPATLPKTMLWIIDASTYTSLQTFSPWPIDRAPGSKCP
ncbi:MAG TPA: hypothetical protein VIK11_03835 [Tepidiformaceae bacterium]